MPTSDVLDDTTGRTLRLTPRWLRLPAAVAYSGISRSKLYVHLAEGRIRAACVPGRGKVRGTRLFDRESIDEFLVKSSTGEPETPANESKQGKSPAWHTYEQIKTIGGQ